ncbi:MAG: zinc dependent phospholipase C family protein [Blautia sp.]|nr:zinc dependent phospholipase C family protein [Blautia sp.]MDY5032055.1 zinc dependent phospholipase C family protein [Blautia sp.]
MPTTYAHDLFGKKVYKLLPEEMKRVVYRNRELYRIGQHGPDILFYFCLGVNPVTRFGVMMHQEKAADFFRRGMKIVRDEKDEALYGYLIGFACHYILDSTCHPYINEMDHEGKVTHTLLEKEMDRELMLRTGKDPLVYHPSDCVVPRLEYAAVIHRALPGIPTRILYLSLKLMKFFTNLMVCNDGEKRRRLVMRFSFLGGKKVQGYLRDHFMRLHPDRSVQCYVDEALRLYDEALEKVPHMLRELSLLAKEDRNLAPEWFLNYKGK